MATGVKEITGARFVSPTPMRITPRVLEGRIVKLLPMKREHAPALLEAAQFPELWRVTANGPLTTLDEMLAYMEIPLADQETGRSAPFVTTLRESGEVIGSTRFANIIPADRKADIGWSWVRPDRQRSGANSEAKTLMMEYAFDVCGALRLQIRTDFFNTKSQRAIERLGATREGVLRQDMVVQGGRVRDTVLYSITDLDWRDPLHRVHQHAIENGITPLAECPI